MSFLEQRETKDNPPTSPTPETKMETTPSQSRWLWAYGWMPAWLRKMDRGILALTIVFVLTLPLFTPRIYASDEIKYFSYLHSIFFDHDVDFTNEYSYFYNSDPVKYADFKASVINKLNEKGLPVNEGPVGSAILWTPFYGIAHVAALAGNALGLKSFKPDGFSTPYVWAVTLASLLYGFAGLIFSYLLARNFMPSFWAAFGTITVWLASPVIFYMSLTPPMSHANSLFMISLWLWLWYRTREWRFDKDGKFTPGVRRGSMWLLLGVLGGLTAMVREQDGTVLIVGAVESLFLYWHFWRNRPAPASGGKAALIPPGWLSLFGRNLVFLFGLAFSLVPQFIVYAALNGHPGPSKTVGDKLQFFSLEVPGRLLGLLGDPDHGLFWWAPVLLPALVGLVMLVWRKEFRLVAIVLLFAFFAELYISASFQTWTMKGSFGPRRLIGISPAYIVGLGFLGWWLSQLKTGWKISKRVLVGLATLFIIWNFGVIIQFTTLREGDSRQGLDPARVVVDQFTKVPGKLIDTAERFLFKRDSFYKK
ncbi:MAG: hypothetical protein J0I20_29020 [Chloroflexi bacterium]|nr:hypothetical protein [Chloroflexota bacterium]OJV96349.1 MAG: hypothetical protein BGO39_01155 [Chloroflexi bacterium 54-19]